MKKRHSMQAITKSELEGPYKCQKKTHSKIKIVMRDKGHHIMMKGQSIKMI